MRTKKCGYTLIEMLVVVMILGILASMAVPMYLKTVENAKAMDAVATASMISAGLRVFVTEHPGAMFQESILTDTCNTLACNPNVYTACTLVACNYVARQKWSGLSYYWGVLGTGTGAFRSTTPPLGTTNPKYKDWAYGLFVDGTCENRNGAPRCPGT